MSGGAYQYLYREIEKLADLLERNDEYQPIRDRISNALKEIAKQCQIIEWIDSYDCSPKDFEKVKKWLDEHNFI